MGSRIWITEPTRTPLSSANVAEARASPGSDWSGIRPATSLTVRARSRGVSSNASNPWLALMASQEAQPTAATNGARTGVT